MKKIAIVFLISAIFLFTPVFAQAKTYDDFKVESNSTSDVTVNLFDYWLEEEDSDDTSVGNFENRGINANHIFLFGKGMPSTIGWWNRWSGSVAIPVTNIVYPLLDQNGYPVLNISQDDIDAVANLQGRTSESLAYLFDPTIESEYKKSYTNVKGLLSYSETLGDNYSCYNNFAKYNKDTNRIDLYSKPGVIGNFRQGQFFPFADLEDVFKIENDELVINKETTSQNASINHFLGMSIETEFIQPKDGCILNDKKQQQEMIFTFTGDDDIWIFIDGVLISDLGGIHDTITTTINFSTGKVTIRPKEDNAVRPSENLFEYYLGEKYEAVQGELETNYLEDNIVKETDELGQITKYTYRDNTKHELKIFYLERGHTDSSLEASFWPTINGEKHETDTPQDPSVPQDTPSIENPETNDYISIVVITMIIAGAVSLLILKSYKLHLKRNQ